MPRKGAYMLKRLVISIYSWLFGAGGADWTDAKPLPLHLRISHGLRSARQQPKLRRCRCGLLHDHPTREKCARCEHGTNMRQSTVVPMVKRTATR